VDEWEVRVTDELLGWVDKLDPKSKGLVVDAIDRLAEAGPGLGRPLVDRLAGSEIHNLKELRPASAGSSEIRIIFVFDPWRSAILLVGGDKSGDWLVPKNDSTGGKAVRRICEGTGSRGGQAMTEFPKWNDVRAGLVTDVGGEQALADARRHNQAYIDGHRLAERRKALGLTQTEVAEHMGISKSRVSQIERGEVSTVDVIARYVQALGGQIQITAVFGDDLYILRGTDTQAA